MLAENPKVLLFNYENRICRRVHLSIRIDVVVMS